ncbi:MAG TPA: hypothetical protein VG713_19920 [Pirellulales bacterium]|nr:hypothetical protein [Pirellulales bacterium]
MARSRIIKPEFYLNEKLVALHPLTRLLYPGLWQQADRDGRLEDRPLRLKLAILPYDNCDVDTMLQELHDEGFIVRYEVDGIRYIAIPAFSEHQSPHVSEKSRNFPGPPDSAPVKHGASTVQESVKHGAGTNQAPPVTRSPSPHSDSDSGSDSDSDSGSGSKRASPDGEAQSEPDGGFKLSPGCSKRSRSSTRSRKPKSEFVKPTVEEVRKYCLERKNGIAPEEFVDFYDANGWVQGDGTKPIKDWKAAVRTWEHRRHKDLAAANHQRRRRAVSGQDNTSRVNGGGDYGSLVSQTSDTQTCGATP